MMSGALSSSNLFNLLFLLRTLLYSSFKSDVANLPPSSITKGLKSGGITGRTSKTIHSSLFPDSKKSSTNLSLFTIFFLVVSEFVFANSILNFALSSFKSMLISIVFITSAPIPA